MSRRKRQNGSWVNNGPIDPAETYRRQRQPQIPAQNPKGRQTIVLRTARRGKNTGEQ